MNQPNSSPSLSAQALPSADALRAVYANKQVGELFEFGRYPQGANGEVEPITWRVLQREADRLLVVAEQGLDCKPYHEDQRKISWADCTLHRWLNSEFYDNAFNERERKCILKTSIVNNEGPKTEDSVFLLSIDEAQSLFADDSVRHARLTDYAIKSKAYFAYDNGCCWWWLRSRGIGGDRAACVAPDGLVGNLGLGVGSDNIAVRPALSVHITPNAANCVTKSGASRNYLLFSAVLTVVAVIFCLSMVMLRGPGLGVPSPEPTGTIAVAQSVASSPDAMGTPAIEQGTASSPEPTRTPAIEQGEASSSEPMGTSAVAQSVASSASPLNTIYADKQVDEYFEFGRYPQGAHGEIEPITWRVLQREADHLLVIAEHGLDCQQYDNEFRPTTWADCALRRWLNSEFYDNAFNERERKCILKTSIVNNGGPKTEDSVFLLSIDEAQSLFADDNVRHARPTDYAIKSKAYSAYDNGCCWWWLRSRGSHDNDAAYVRPDGCVFSNGGHVNYDIITVRPVFKIAL